MNKLYITLLFLNISSLLNCMIITPLPIPEEISQHILLQQFNYIPDHQYAWTDACKDIIIFKRVNKSCYNYTNNSQTVYTFIHKLYKQFPNEAHLYNFSKLLQSPGIIEYCNKCQQLNSFDIDTIIKVAQEGADVNCRFFNRETEAINTPLTYFASCNNSPGYFNRPYLEIIQTLINLNADYNVQLSNKSVLTSAIYSHDAYRSSLPIITLLLNYDYHHAILKNALNHAIAYNLDNIAEMLIEKIKRTSPCIQDDLTPGLLSAAKLKQQDLMHKLLESGANPSQLLAKTTKKILYKQVEQKPIEQLNEKFTLLCHYLPKNNNKYAVESIDQLNAIINLATKLLTIINIHEK